MDSQEIAAYSIAANTRKGNYWLFTKHGRQYRAYHGASGEWYAYETPASQRRTFIRYCLIVGLAFGLPIGGFGYTCHKDSIQPVKVTLWAGVDKPLKVWHVTRGQVIGSKGDWWIVVDGAVTRCSGTVTVTPEY